MDKVNDYFSASFHLTDTTYLAGETEKNGIQTGWKLYRIPLTNFNNVSSTEWNEIRYIRLAVSDLDSTFSTLQIAKIEIVGNEWQELGIYSPPYESSRNLSPVLKKENLIVDPKREIETADKNIPSFQIAVINTEDNSDYQPPDGV